MEGFRTVAYKVKLSLGILDIGDGIRFKGVYKVRKFDGIPDKKYFKIITYQVPVSVFRVHFYGKTPRIP